MPLDRLLICDRLRDLPARPDQRCVLGKTGRGIGMKI